MKKTTLKPAFAVLAIAMAVAGCKSGSSSSGGGGTGGGGANNLVANTSGATAFAFLQGNQNPASAAAPQAMSAKAPVLFNSNSSYCDSLVKIVEIHEPDIDGDGNIVGQKTEKVFEQMGDGAGCQISNVYMMKDALILEGLFSQLADIDNSIIHECKLISLPLKSSKTLPHCIVQGWDVHEPDGVYVRYIYQVDVSNDGQYLMLSHDFDSREHIDDGRREFALSLWSYSDSNIRTIYNFNRIEPSASNSYIKSWLNQPDYIILEDNLKGVAQRETRLQSAVIPGNDGFISPEEVATYSWFKSEFDPIKIGDFLIHNWKNSFDDKYHLVFNLASQSPVEFVNFNSPFGEDAVLHDIMFAKKINTDATVFFGRFYNTYGFVKIDHENLSLESVQDMSDKNIAYHTLLSQHVGESHMVYMLSRSDEIYAFDMISLELINSGDDILNDTLTQDLVVSGTNLYAGGLRVIGSQYGVSKEFFFDQLTQKWTEEPLDRSEIGQSIPLLPDLPN